MRKNDGYSSYKEDMIRELHSQIELLQRENALLKKENAMLEASYQQMKEIHDSVLEEYKQGIAETREMRNRMSEVLHDSLIAKKEYADKMNLLLEKMKESNKKLANMSSAE